MGKVVADAVLDAAFDRLINNCIELTVCAGEPSDYGSATTQGAQMLARTIISGADYTKANGDTNGRKVTIGQQTGIPVSATGGANHVCLLTSATISTIEYITTATSQNLTAGNTLTVNAWDIEIADPT